MGFKQFVAKNLPTILTVAGVAGVGATVFFAIKVTPEAKRRVDDLKKEKDQEVWNECEKQWLEANGYSKGGEHDGETPDDAEWFVGATNIRNEIPDNDKMLRPSVKDVVKEVAPLYIPTALMGGASIACFIAANSISVQRLTATSAALTATEEAFRTYKNKVIEQIGEKKAAEVIEKIAKDKVDKNPPAVTKEDGTVAAGEPVIITGAGEALCYDAYTGRYFKSDIDKIHRIVNTLNNRLNREDFISLNEFYYELGLPSVTMGNQLGWDAMNGLIDITFSSILADEEHGGGPVLVLDFLTAPRYGFGDLHRY